MVVGDLELLSYPITLLGDLQTDHKVFGLYIDNFDEAEDTAGPSTDRVRSFAGRGPPA